MQKRYANSVFFTVAAIGALHKGFQFTTSFFMPQMTAAFFASSMLASLIKIDKDNSGKKDLKLESIKNKCRSNNAQAGFLDTKESAYFL